MYDVSCRDSFEHVKSWYDRAKMLGGADLQTVLIGNKTDLSHRQVAAEEGQEVARELGIPFIETSALSGANIETAFVCMTANIKKSVDERGLSGVKDTNLKSAGGVQLATSEKKMTMTQKCGCQ